MEKKVQNQYRVLTEFLIQKHLTITTMESCTSGLIASLLTDTPGSSAILKGAFVTYCNEAKILQGVPKDIIETYGVYSKETATAMALASKRVYEANIGIGVSGTMGNVDPNNYDSVPGEVYFALIVENEIHSYHIQLAPQESRYAYKLCVAEKIANELFKLLSIAS